MPYWVYILTNNQRSHVLYAGVTNDLERRAFEHKNKLTPGFTSRYNLTRLVYFEQFFGIENAIAREKEIKGWKRSKKIALIKQMNPQWHDLAAHWHERYKPQTSHPTTS
jgi:putative endonuclease